MSHNHGIFLLITMFLFSVIRYISCGGHFMMCDTANELMANLIIT